MDKVATLAPTEVIETPRLRLRPLTGQDFEPLWRIWSEAAVQEHLITRPQTIDDFEPMFFDMSAQSASGTLWVVTDLAESVLGRAGFYRYGDQPPEFAILLTETSWGAGMATEATAACLKHGFEDCGWNEVVAVMRPTNVRVRRVLDKVGFSERSEAEIRGKAAVWFGISADEWRARQV